MSSSALAIANLLYRYTEAMDSGNLEGAAELFRHARIKVRDRAEPLNAAGLLALWREHVKLYPCGTPRTKHVVTNPIIEIDENGGKAAVRSYYTVYQAAEGFPLQLIASGRYHDEFERVGGVWRFSYRDYSMLDLMGDMSFHLNVPVTGQ
jgi:3-phenylpropionate/cinnamic acid dioxygenase small subunit